MTHVSAAATVGRMELPASIVERQPREVQYTVLRRVLADEMAPSGYRFLNCNWKKRKARLRARPGR